MRPKSPKIISEVQKVRFLVMDIIYHNPGRSVMIPSSNELAAHFGIARSTVRLALEKMTEEGYLFTKRGTGTFTMPQSIKNGSARLPLIGIRIASGDLFYYDAPMLNELGIIFQAVARRNCNVRLLTDSANSVDDYERILDNAYIDALITISVDAEFSQLAAQRMPVVAIGFEAEGVNSIVYSGTKVIADMLKFRQSDRKLRVMALGNTADLKLFYKEMSECQDIDLIRESSGFRNNDDMINFQQAISRFMPDFICLREGQINAVKKVLKEMVEPRDSVRILKLDASDPRPFEYGVKLDIDLGKVLATAVDEAIRLMSVPGDSDDKPFRHIIDYNLVNCSKDKF